MPETCLYEEAVKKPTKTYGDKSLIVDFPRGHSSIGAWLSLPVPQTAFLYKFQPTPYIEEDQKDTVSDWPEKKDPFTKEDLLNSEDNQLQQLIFQIRISTYIPNNERLANRLIALFNNAKEEDPDSTGISVDSIRSFYNFFQKHTYLKYPIITLTPDNDIYASWKGGQNQVFSVHFVSNEDVRFVIFKPNENNPERKIITYGTDTVDTLMKTVAFSGIWDWISDER